MSPCSSIVGLYFKGTCDVISVTMAMHKVLKRDFGIAIARRVNILQKLFSSKNLCGRWRGARACAG